MGLPPPDPRSLCPQLNLFNHPPLPNKIPVYATGGFDNDTRGRINVTSSTVINFTQRFVELMPTAVRILNLFNDDDDSSAEHAECGYKMNVVRPSKEINPFQRPPSCNTPLPAFCVST